MKLVRYDDGRIGAVVNDRSGMADAPLRIIDLTATLGIDRFQWPPVGMVRVIKHFEDDRIALDQLIANARGTPFDAARLLTPIPWPNKLIAYPANYRDPATAMKQTGVGNPQGFFLKANSSLVGAHDAIELPDLPDLPGRSVHHQCELAIIIGREGRGIRADDAMDHIFGYACLLDITIRGAETRVMRKSYDTFTVVGPWIVTADEVGDPSDLHLQLWVNDQLKQDARTRDLLVDIPDMVALASSAATLYPGDIIATGTPAGVGPIVGGDIVTIEIERVGRMQVPVKQGFNGRNVVFDRPLEV